jgi:hypothetical protein
MERPLILTAIRLGSAALVIVAMVTVAIDLAGRDRFDPSRFFAFFTIQSNLIGVAAITWSAIASTRSRSRAHELLRGAAVVYLTVTFFVVIFLLSGADVQLDLVWVDFVLHKLFPVIVVLDWLIDPPGVRLAYSDALYWIVYPLVWAGLTMARGAFDGWYPYPFLDPASGGYGQVAITVGAITIGFLVISAAVIWLGRWRSAARA